MTTTATDQQDTAADVSAEAVNACLSTLIAAGLSREEVLAGALAAAVTAIAAECSGREAAKLCLFTAQRVAGLPAIRDVSLAGMRPHGSA